MTVWRGGTMLATLAGVMAVLGVVRTTRGDEEAGRTELVRSGSVGRHAPTAAAVLVALGGGIVLGLLVVLGMVAAGTPVAGSVAYGAGLAGTSAVFVGVGAVASQLAGSARAAKGLGLAVVGTSYLARAVSDGTATSPGTSNLLSWLSPVGWTALAHPYAGERWWVLALPALTTAVLLAGAVILEGRRDHGSGFWTSGPGGRQAGPTLSHPRGLALRLHRAGIAAWAVGVSAWALLMGAAVHRLHRGDGGVTRARGDDATARRRRQGPSGGLRARPAGPHRAGRRRMRRPAPDAVASGGDRRAS